MSGNLIHTNPCWNENRASGLNAEEIIDNIHTPRANLNHNCFDQDQSLFFIDRYKKAIQIIVNHKSAGSRSIRNIKGPKSQNKVKNLSNFDSFDNFFMPVLKHELKSNSAVDRNFKNISNLIKIIKK